MLMRLSPGEKTVFFGSTSSAPAKRYSSTLGFVAGPAGFAQPSITRKSTSDLCFIRLIHFTLSSICYILRGRGLLSGTGALFFVKIKQISLSFNNLLLYNVKIGWLSIIGVDIKQNTVKMRYLFIFGAKTEYINVTVYLENC